MKQNLANAEIICGENTSLEIIVSTIDDSEFGYLVQVGLKYPD